MRFVIKQVRSSGELWLVRLAGHGVWGAQERARVFATKAASEARLAGLRAAADGFIEIAAVRDAVSGVAVSPDEGPQETAEPNSGSLMPAVS
jgi:hypothetical protein